MFLGEELIIENTEEALKRTCKATGAELIDYTVAPCIYERQNAREHMNGLLNSKLSLEVSQISPNY